MEKDIQAIGLFMQKDIVKDSDIFPTLPLNDECSFVFITQSLTRVERGDLGEFPLDAWLVEQTEELYLLTPDVLYLKQLHYFGENHPVQKVREKYKATLTLFRQQYPRTMAFLEAHNFKLEDCSPSADWSKAVAQWPQSYDWAVKERKYY
jgi:hypothetical protein